MANLIIMMVSVIITITAGTIAHIIIIIHGITAIIQDCPITITGTVILIGIVHIIAQTPVITVLADTAMATAIVALYVNTEMQIAISEGKDKQA